MEAHAGQFAARFAQLSPPLPPHTSPSQQPSEVEPLLPHLGSLPLLRLPWLLLLEPVKQLALLLRVRAVRRRCVLPLRTCTHTQAEVMSTKAESVTPLSAHHPFANGQSLLFHSEALATASGLSPIPIPFPTLPTTKCPHLGIKLRIVCSYLSFLSPNNVSNPSWPPMTD